MSIMGEVVERSLENETILARIDVVIDNLEKESKVVAVARRGYRGRT